MLASVVSDAERRDVLLLNARTGFPNVYTRRLTDHCNVITRPMSSDAGVHVDDIGIS